ncbi:uncharacterized protein LOC143221925 [Lasioglossum baleicum]|uniref:uncharacterized protein LOC143221925 n=1 Tax=Lasioglossum baleicum TaxID=434251 RepID=UPI003FCEB06D
MSATYREGCKEGLEPRDRAIRGLMVARVGPSSTVARRTLVGNHVFVHPARDKLACDCPEADTRDQQSNQMLIPTKKILDKRGERRWRTIAGGIYQVNNCIHLYFSMDCNFDGSDSIPSVIIATTPSRALRAFSADKLFASSVIH